MITPPLELEYPTAPPEPVNNYTAGDENLYFRGVSGKWYFYKIL